MPLPQGVELLPDGRLNGSNEHAMAGGWRNRLSNPIIAAAGIPVHATWNTSVALFGGHLRAECTHWCSPGAHNIWVWSLWRTLVRLEGSAGQAAGKTAGRAAGQATGRAARQQR